MPIYGGDPTMAAAGWGQEPVSGSSILDWMRRMAQLRAASPRFGGDPTMAAAGWRAPAPPAASPTPAAAPPTPPPPSVAPTAPFPSIASAPMSPMTGRTAAGIPMTPEALFRNYPQPGTSPAIPTAQTKTEPAGSLRFSWRGTPETYTPGVSDVLEMRGAPEARGGFMGAPPVAGGTRSGGFAPSQTDWSKVANPAAFSQFREGPAVAETMRSIEDPLWRDRALSAIQQGREIGVGEALIQKQADVVREAQERMRQDADRMYQDEVEAQEEARRAAGQPPLTDEEKDEIWDRVTSRYMSMAGEGPAF
jgi:hypothetical protein